MTETGWKWFIGHDDEVFTSNEETEAAARQVAATEFDGAYIVEARQDPLLLADFIDADELIERAEDNANEYAGEDGPLFEFSGDQAKDLERSLKDAINAWQVKHGLVFKPWRFTEQRNLQYVEPMPREKSEAQ